MPVVAWYQRLHWRLFNVCARLFGLMALASGVAFSSWAAYYAINPSASEGIETGGLPVSAVDAVVGAFSLVVGTAVLRAQPYRPDLGDATWAFRARKGANRDVNRRSWWTGEPHRGSR